MKEPRGRPHHRTVDRVVELLGASTTDPRGLSLSRLAAVLNAPPSSVQKLVYGLVASGMLDEHDGRYVVGPTVRVLAQRGAHKETMPALANGELARLHELTGAAALLVIRAGDQAVTVDSVGLSDAAEYADATRWRHPLHVTAGGRVLAAHLPAQIRQMWIADLFPDDSAGAMRLLDELQAIRENAMATGLSGSLRPDLEAVAVPLRRGGAVVAAVALARPKSGGADLADLGRVLRRELTATGAEPDPGVRPTS